VRPSDFPNSPSQTSNHKQKCHPDRSEAKWRDLLSPSHAIESEWKRYPPLCHPERSRGICGAPLGLPEFSASNLNPQTEVSSRPDRSAWRDLLFLLHTIESE
jgi:hypothetical protein